MNFDKINLNNEGGAVKKTKEMQPVTSESRLKRVQAALNKTELQSLKGQLENIKDNLTAERKNVKRYISDLLKLSNSDEDQAKRVKIQNSLVASEVLVADLLFRAKDHQKNILEKGGSEDTFIMQREEEFQGLFQEAEKMLDTKEGDFTAIKKEATEIAESNEANKLDNEIEKLGDYDREIRMMASDADELSYEARGKNRRLNLLVEELTNFSQAFNLFKEDLNRGLECLKKIQSSVAEFADALPHADEFALDIAMSNARDIAEIAGRVSHQFHQLDELQYAIQASCSSVRFAREEAGLDANENLDALQRKITHVWVDMEEDCVRARQHLQVLQEDSLSVDRLSRLRENFQAIG